MGLMGFLKKTQKKDQQCLILGEDRHIDNPQIPIEKGHMDSKNTYEAWYLRPRWLVWMKELNTYVQILAERNCIPLPLGLIYGLETEQSVKDLMWLKPLAKEKFHEEKNWAEMTANKNKFLMNFITIGGGAMGVCILIIALISLFQSGKLQLPGIGG